MHSTPSVGNCFRQAVAGKGCDNFCTENLQSLLECTDLGIKVFLLAHNGLQLSFQLFLEHKDNKLLNHSSEHTGWTHQKSQI